MNSKEKRLKNFKLYGVTDIKKNDKNFLQRVEKALQGGVDILQLRSKTLSDKELFLVGKKLRVLTHQYKKLFFINDRPDLCRALHADGIHIGQDDLPVSEVRKMIPKGCFVGKSTHSLRQAKDTLKESVDYIGCGPIFQTPTKPDYQSVGLGLIKKVRAISKIPVVCIGGIHLGNVQKVVISGGERVAVVRALFDAKDPKKAANKFKEALN